jgi:conjugal transfer pilus assembly protein TraE
MKRERLAGGIARLTSEVRFLRASLLTALAVTLLMLIRLLTADTDIRLEVAVPPAVAKDFWISTSSFGPAYLEQMGTFIAYMVLNSTPASLKFQAEQLKPYLAPEAWGKLQADLEAKRERFDRYQMSTLFYPSQIYLSKSRCRIQVEGELKTFIGGKPGSTKTRKLDIGCKNVNGRFYVTSIALTGDDDHDGGAD